MHQRGEQRESDPYNEIASSEPNSCSEWRALRPGVSAHTGIIGTADGVIMPTIITVHMANTNANSSACHGMCAGIMRPIPDGIIRNPAMSMPPMPMSAESHSK